MRHLFSWSVAVILTAVSGALLPAPASAQVPAGAGRQDYVYDDGVTRSVGSLLFPKDYSPAASATYPLVIAYHGWDEFGTDYSHLAKNFGNLFTRGHDTSLPDGGFFVYAPQSPTQGWNEANLDTTMRMLAVILEEHKVDRTKLYVTGLSNGGGAVWLMAAQYHDVLSAAVPICGADLSGDDSGAGLKNEYIWAFHARDDARQGAEVYRTRNKVNAIRTALGHTAFTAWPTGTADWDYETQLNHAQQTPRLKYKEYGTGGHTIWGRVYGYDTMYSWMRSLSTPVTTLEPGETMLFDFGNQAVATDSQNRAWNSVSSSTAQRMLLPFKPFAKTSTGTRKFVVAEVTGAFNGGVSTGGVSTGTMRYDANITRDSWRTGSASEVGVITLRGLVPGASYDLTLFASAGTTSNGWTTLYRAEGKSAELVVGNNATGTALLSNVVARADGTLALEVQAKAPATQGYIGALELRRSSASVQPFYCQDFQEGSALGTYYATPPTVGQLTDITSDWSVPSGRLQQTRSATSAQTGFTRLQQTGVTPAAVVAEFDLHVTGTSNSSDLAFFDFGPLTTQQAYPNSIPNTQVAGRLLIRGDGGPGIRFQLNGAYSSSGDIPTFANGTTWKVVWATNRSAAARSYEAPDGSMRSVATGTSDVWVGNAATGAYSLVFDDMPQASVHTATTLGGFRVRSVSTASITVAFDNLCVYPLQ